VHQAFERAVHDEAGLLEGGDDRREAGDCHACPRRAHRDRMRIARRRQHNMEYPGAEPQQGQFSEVDIELPRLGFGENGSAVTRLNAAALERLAERVDPLALDPVGQHGILRLHIPAHII
jgi:hypothetical protein